MPGWVNDDNAALVGTLLPALGMVVVSLLTKNKKPVEDYGKRLREMEAQQARSDRMAGN